MTFLEKAKPETQSRSVVGWGWGWEVRFTENGQEETLEGDENALKL